VRAVRLPWRAAVLGAVCGAVAGLATVPVNAGSDAMDHVDVPVPANQRMTLSNGLRLILVPRRDVPLIACSLTLRGGARLDPPGQAGTAALAADLLTHGSGSRDAYAFADAVEGAGGSLAAEVHAEAIEVHGQFLARDSALMLELLSDAVLRPRFDAGEFDKLRTRRIEEIKAAKDSSPQALLGNYGRALLFGSHGYGKPVGGSEQSLARIRPADVRRLYAAQAGADHATLVIAGDFDAAQIRAEVSRRFGVWPRAAAALPAIAETPRVTGRRVLLVDAPGSTQTYFWLANVGVSRHFPQRAALEIATSAFGGSFGSMLNQELRVKTGLTYGASARFARGSAAGEFAIGSFTETGNTARAIDLTLETLARVRRDGLDKATIDSARNYLLGQYPLSFETSSDWAQALGELDLYGLPESEIGRFGSALMGVDVASVQAVIAATYPSPEDLDIVLIGDAARIGEVAARLGPVTQTALAAPDFSARTASP